MATQPFREFARHYDRFMAQYVDYRSWVDYVERIFKRFKAEPKHILDVACGTGIPTVLLAQRGFMVTGVDRSAEMLSVLEGKRYGLPIEMIQADMTDFRLEQSADAAVSFYDSVNYLLSEEDLVKCFTCVKRALVKGGLFVFDMNTVYSLSTFWGNRTTPRNVGDVSSLWQNTFDWKTMISTLHLTFWEEAGGTEEGRAQNHGQKTGEARTQNADTGTQKSEAVGCEPLAAAVRFEEEHRERAYTEKQVRDCLKRAGFARAWFYTHGTFLPVTPITVRMMVVAK